MNSYWYALKEYLEKITKEVRGWIYGWIHDGIYKGDSDEIPRLNLWKNS